MEVKAKEAKANVAAHAHLGSKKDTVEITREAQEEVAKAKVKADAEAEARKPPKIVLSGDRKGVSGGEKWDTGAEEVVKEDSKTEEERNLDNVLNGILKRSPIIIFSKSYCPHSKQAKAVFGLYDITPAPFIVELDLHSLGSQLQAALEKITGRRTVPNVLISGTSLGGGDETQALHDKGELVDKIRELGGKRIMEAKPKTV